jgi:hypothetical protein
MKKKYFFMAICISIIGLKANAQMDYIKKFDNRLDFRTANGEKVFVEEIENTDNYNCIGVNIYGTDFILKKSIRPNVPNLADIARIFRTKAEIPFYEGNSELFTENVFNQDNLLEFIAIIQNDGNLNEVVIVNEYNQILWRKKWDNGITITFPDVKLYPLDDQNEKFLLSFELTDANNHHFTEYYSVSNSTALRLTKVAETPAPYPNPSKGIIQLTYNLENAPEGIIHIFNTEGQEIRTLKVDGNAEAVSVNTSGMASGNYFYSVEADGKQLGKNRFMVK